MNIGERQISEVFSGYLKQKHPYYRIYRMETDSYMLLIWKKT